MIYIFSQKRGRILNLNSFSSLCEDFSKDSHTHEESLMNYAMFIEYFLKITLNWAYLCLQHLQLPNLAKLRVASNFMPMVFHFLIDFF
jgi:hypothetical protein